MAIFAGVEEVDNTKCVRTQFYMSYQPKKQGGFLNFLFTKEDNPKYFYALCAVKFLLSLTFTIFKNQKTSNIVLKKGAGSIPSMKLIVFFVAILAAYVYTSLSNRISYQRLSYGLLGFFFGMFALYAFVIYPNLNAIKPNVKQIAPNYQDYMLVKLWGDWPIVLFYLLAELFGQFCIIVFFWGVANDIYNKQQARRFYQWFIGAGCLGGVVGAQLSKKIIRFCSGSLTGVGHDSPAYNRMLLEKASQVTSLCALVILALTGLLYKYIQDHIAASQGVGYKRVKKQPSFMESIRLIYTSKYLVALAVMIISCGVSMNIVQVTYRGYLKNNAGNDVIKYMDYEANAALVLNVLCILGCFFLTPFLVKHLSWKKLAALAPVIVFVFGFTFFTASTFRHWGWLSFLGDTKKQVLVVTWIAWFDAVFGTFTKYLLFDNVKERAWLGVSRTMQRQGKGPIDVVSSRSGKAVSSVVHIILMNLFMVGEDVTVLSPYLLVVFSLLIGIWLYSVNYIGNELEQQSKNNIGNSA